MLCSAVEEHVALLLKPCQPVAPLHYVKQNMQKVLDTYKTIYTSHNMYLKAAHTPMAHMKPFNSYNYLYIMVPVCLCSYGSSAYSYKTLDEMFLFKYNQKSVLKVGI